MTTTTTGQWMADGDDERPSKPLFRAYYKCGICGVHFVGSDDCVVVNWVMDNGEIGQQPMHRNCADMHPMNIANMLAKPEALPRIPRSLRRRSGRGSGKL